MADKHPTADERAARVIAQAQRERIVPWTEIEKLIAVEIRAAEDAIRGTQVSLPKRSG